MSYLSRRRLRYVGYGVSVTALCACALKLQQVPQAGPKHTIGVVRRTDSSSSGLWGVADLHAHPASHLAFGGLDGQSGLIWGAPWLPDHHLTAIPGGNLPDIPACDPETHEHHIADQVSRATRDLVFQLLTQTNDLAHAPNGGPSGHSGDKKTSYVGWPNGRDVLHQAMNIQSIRRAYEGGLRLMFASTVESQPIGLAMHTTVFPKTFHPTRAVERESAEAQLRYIQSVVSANADWMEIATTPDQAADAIRSNRLAVILALEMDGLLLEDIVSLVKDFGVAAVIPIHLIDNDIGGTAAASDVFNAGTAVMGQMFGYPNRYISVEPAKNLTFHFGWPMTIAVSGPALMPGAVQYNVARPLGYNEYALCTPRGHGIPAELGTMNGVGLRKPEAILELMRLGVMVDIAHMGFRSTDETVALAETNCNYPLVDTHTGLQYEGQLGENERSLSESAARYVADHGGVIGLGSSGRVALNRCQRAQTGYGMLASARGGPVASFDGSVPTVTVPMSGNQRACQNPLGGTSAIDKLRLTVSTPDSNPIGPTQPYALITFENGQQQYVPIALKKPNDVLKLDGGPASAIVSIAIGMVDTETCRFESLPTVRIASLTIDDETGTEPISVGPAQLGVLEVYAATLSAARSAVTFYSRCAPDTPLDPTCEPALTALAKISPKKIASQTSSRVRIRMRSGTLGLQAASGGIVGTRVSGSLCTQDGCVGDPCKSPQFVMTPAGAWPPGTELAQYVPYTGSKNFTDVRICVVQNDFATEPWEVDEIDVEDVLDPALLWTADYATALDSIFHDRKGGITLGTDFNGLQFQFPFTDFFPAYCPEVGGCGDAGTGATTTYGRMEWGGVFTLEHPQYVGDTPLYISERGLATYGMLPEFFGAIYHYSPKVYHSLFRSAAVTIEAWRAVQRAGEAFGTALITCDAGAGEGGDEGVGSDGGLEAGGDSDAGREGGDGFDATREAAGNQ